MTERDSLFSDVYREGDRCGGCGYWWWKDGQWHSLIPKLYADLGEEHARIVECPHCQEALRGES